MSAKRGIQIADVHDVIDEDTWSIPRNNQVPNAPPRNFHPLDNSKSLCAHFPGMCPSRSDASKPCELETTPAEKENKRPVQLHQNTLTPVLYGVHTHYQTFVLIVCAVEKVHTICNVNRGSTELIAEISTLYNCIRFPVVGVGVIRWVENTVTEPSYFKLCTESCPLHLALLDEVACVHSSLHDQILRLLIQLFESKQDELEILVQLEMKKMLLDRMVNLLARGCVVPVVKYIRQCCTKGDTDISLIRYFVTEVLETITHPYSPEFVQLFLPMVENEEITGSMRGEGDNDPVSEFIVHCKAHYTTI
ncbi:conserved hypothetical protein [Culex quinquefasciatus]|uniref:Negative elongation factor D n=1 Tax=Culex quinquefasciatus TaxID=7176 RepID=B0X365_CULQU|nr:conserved hypothetical protein [Culex quinquefasciatus]|eukprot:XP_001864087.1 conserved hypothetical protein [Culex quinquefasciatus]